MRTVCLEEHMATQDVFDAWRRRDPELDDFVVRWAVTGSVAKAFVEASHLSSEAKLAFGSANWDRIAAGIRCG